MAKQISIEGTERKQIKEVADAGKEYVRCRDGRMRWTDKEVPAKETLIRVMKKYKLDIYHDDESSPPLLITLKEKPAKDEIKVTVLEVVDEEKRKTPSADEEESEDGEA